ncbi:MAG: hypothetical protein Q9162_007178 [Coniocarpon cinnabarinum]
MAPSKIEPVNDAAHNFNKEPHEDDIPALRKVLTNESAPLAKRFRALFSLKHHAALQPPTPQTFPAIDAIAAAFPSPSALLKHELAYCLGQSRNPAAIKHLRKVLDDRGEDSMCRHEAAEALGALGDEGSLPLLSERRDDQEEAVVVRETCELAVERIQWEHGKQRHTEKCKDSDFSSIDPAPPTPLQSQQKEPDIPGLKHDLMNPRLPLFERYRAMFGLRDLASPPDLPTAVPAVEALAEGFRDSSALFRHEIAFVFGQLSHPASIPSLIRVLGDLKEESMVRHEAAEALGSLGDEQGVMEVLESFRHDQEQVVKDSIIVALDMAEFERSGETEYATLDSNGATSGVAVA